MKILRRFLISATLDEILGVLADNDVKLDKAQKEAVEKHLIKKFGIDEEWQPYSLGIVRKGVIPGSVLNPIMQEVSTEEVRVLTRAERKRMQEAKAKGESAKLSRALSAAERNEPNTLRQAKLSPDWKLWEEAINKGCKV